LLLLYQLIKLIDIVMDWSKMELKISNISGNDEYIGNSYQYIINIDAHTTDGMALTIRVMDFVPHFFIGVPQWWTDKDIQTMINFLKVRFTFAKEIVKLNSAKSISDTIVETSWDDLQIIDENQNTEISVF
jgi:hypothetical protein